MKISLPDKSKPRVLVVDDEDVITKTLEVILDQGGFMATAVNDGATAVRIAATLQPDILLSDVVMPGLDGFETASRICAVSPRCRVFLFSAQCGASDRVREYCMQGYEFEFIAKPVHPSELIARLRAAASHNDDSVRAA